MIALPVYPAKHDCGVAARNFLNLVVEAATKKASQQ
jgi:hypothetical protein